MPVCASTNSVAQELLNKNEATEGCVILTDEQTGGRGQRGNSWEAQPGQNITLSVIFRPVFLPAAGQFFLNMAVSLAVTDLLNTLLPPGTQVKWPNDIYFEDQKLGGILIENSILGSNLQTSIIGIGLNVNQQYFSNPNAVSLKLISGQHFDLAYLTKKLLEALEKRYLQLQKNSFKALQQEYWQHLLGLNEYRFFEVNGQAVTGKITGTDDFGRLAVEINEQIRYFDLKEIKFLFG